MSRLTDEDAREFPAKTVEEGGVPIWASAFVSMG